MAVGALTELLMEIAGPAVEILVDVISDRGRKSKPRRRRPPVREDPPRRSRDDAA